MLAGAAVLIALWLAGVITLFWVEILVALLFIAFWAVQTLELATDGQRTVAGPVPTDGQGRTPEDREPPDGESAP